MVLDRVNFGSFASNKFIYTSLNNSQSNKALCFSLRDKSILNLLHNASREFEVPGNLFLATSKESITSFLFMLSFCIDSSSPSRKPRSNVAL